MEKFEDIILDETDDYWVIDKPPGLAVMPPSKSKTLLDLLLERKLIVSDLWSDDRFGVVHRLDADTSGLLVWAKNPSAQENLQLLWQKRQVKKIYRALVYGQLERIGEIDLSISRNTRKDRQQVDIIPNLKSRPALTRYQALAIGEYDKIKISYLELQAITGRTHQLRVHLKAIRHPILGDQLYNEKTDRVLSKKLGVKRQLLHSYQLELPNQVKYISKIPADFNAILKLVIPNFVNSG